MKTLIYYTDAISALVRAITPIEETLQDAKGRGDEDLVSLLQPVNRQLRSKLSVLLHEAWKEEDWNAGELSLEDAQRLAVISRRAV